MKAYWGTGIRAPGILHLSTRRRWVVNFTPRPLYPQGKCHWYPLDRMLGVPRVGLDAVVKGKIPSPCRESNHRPSTFAGRTQARLCYRRYHLESSSSALCQGVVMVWYLTTSIQSVTRRMTTSWIFIAVKTSILESDIISVHFSLLQSKRRMRTCAYSFVPSLTFFFQLASTVLIGPWPSLMDFSIHRHLVGLLGWGISQTQGL
jgi:hypothetical protein